MPTQEAPNGPVVEITDYNPDGLCLVPMRVKVNGEVMLIAKDGVEVLMHQGVIAVRLTLMPSKLICAAEGEGERDNSHALFNVAVAKATEANQGGAPSIGQVYEALTGLVARR